MEDLTNQQWDAVLEAAAKRIEESLKDPEDAAKAAKIVREFKTQK